MDRKELEYCVRHYEPEVSKALAFLYTCLASRGKRLTLDDREDLAQEFRVILYKCLCNYKPERGDLENYIRATLHRQAKGAIREYMRPKHLEQDLQISLNQILPGTDECELVATIPDAKAETVDKIDRRIFCESLLDCLDNREREWVKLWVDGATLDDIAQMYQYSRQHVGQVIQSAISKMKIEGSSGQKGLF